jgi:hypothetical protein
LICKTDTTNKENEKYNFTSKYNRIFVLVSCSEKKNETKPQRKNITEMVFASGMLEADNQYNLSAQIDGYFVK